MESSPANSPVPPIETLLLLDHETLVRLRSIWRLLCVGLVDLPVAVRLVSDTPAADQLAFGPVQVIRHPALIWPWRHRRMEMLLGNLEDRPPEVVHACSTSVLPTAMEIAAEFDSDIVLQVTSRADVDGLLHGKPHTDLRIVVGSQPLQAALAAVPWVRAERVKLIRPGLRADSHATCFQDSKRVPTLICYEPMESGHGMELLIDALVLLQRRGLEVLAFLLGSGSREHLVHRSVVEHGLSSRVSFANPVGDPRALMHDADIFVVPVAENALTETSVLAMTSGVAVVAMEGGVADFYDHERTALLCREATASALADAMARLIQDRALGQRLAAGALAHMKTHHGMSSMVENTFQVYQSMADVHRNIPLSNPPQV